MYQTGLNYIEQYWPRLTCAAPQDHGVYIGLPNPFVTPSGQIFQGDQFYWDSYFIILGLVTQPKYVELAKGMVDNFVYLYNRFEIIPERNRFYNIGVSQPPFLTSMMWEVFERTHDKTWLRTVTDTAAREYQYYWMYDGLNGQNAVAHNVYEQLSRYCDHYVMHATAEHESGWDTTARFQEQCLNYLPVDLNSLLYKYETDLARSYELLQEADLATYFVAAAQRRQSTMQKLFWDAEQRFFLDYDYVQQRHNTAWTLASYYPLWAKWATQEQSDALATHLSQFLQAGGLTNTLPLASTEPKQWDYPNGWANQHWIVIQGLRNYGHHNLANDVATRWLNMNQRVFEHTGQFWECYDVVQQRPAPAERYPRQAGFGWTNGVFTRLALEKW